MTQDAIFIPGPPAYEPSDVPRTNGEVMAHALVKADNREPLGRWIETMRECLDVLEQAQRGEVVYPADVDFAGHYLLSEAEMVRLWSHYFGKLTPAPELPRNVALLRSGLFWRSELAKRVAPATNHSLSAATPARPQPADTKKGSAVKAHSRKSKKRSPKKR